MHSKINLTKWLFLGLSGILLCLNSFAQNPERFFNPKDLTQVGVYYYPEHWDSTQWERDFQNMAKMGFEFTHFAEFAWAQLEPSEGRYDFKWLDRSLQLADKYHLKVILCTSTATPPVWLVRKHPDVLATNEDGTKMDHGSRQHATFSSNYYRMYSMKMIEQLATIRKRSTCDWLATRQRTPSFPRLRCGCASTVPRLAERKI